MPRAGPRKVGRYSDEFKLTAVRLSQQPGIHVQTVAAALTKLVQDPKRAMVAAPTVLHFMNSLAAEHGR